jgi:hypothetical protein
MPETTAFRGWKAQHAIEWSHGIGGDFIQAFHVECRSSPLNEKKLSFGIPVIRLRVGQRSRKAGDGYTGPLHALPPLTGQRPQTFRGRWPFSKHRL